MNVRLCARFLVGRGAAPEVASGCGAPDAGWWSSFLRLFPGGEEADIDFFMKSFPKVLLSKC